MRKKIHEEAEAVCFGATIIGRKRIAIKLNEIHCPICGDKMKMCEYDSSKETFTQRHIRRSRSILDDGGIRHVSFYGREERRDSYKVHLCCPSGCVEKMTLNVSDIQMGEYKEFDDMAMHEKL